MLFRATFNSGTESTVPAVQVPRPLQMKTEKQGVTIDPHTKNIPPKTTD